MARKAPAKKDKLNDYKKPGRHLTLPEILDGIERSEGTVTSVADTLGVARNTVYHWIEIHPEVGPAIKDCREKMKDFVESQLLKNIKAQDTTSIIFFLKTQGKDRGYIERQETHHSGGIDLKPAGELTDDQLSAIAQGNPSGSGKGTPS